MDPTTTLFTFMLQTHPSVNMVHLVGSWDNFSRTHAMERDTRRDAGQWRGCHSFKDITCDGDSGSTPRRNGGLKMGHTYYYYYELDGSSETHDPSLPSTNNCPYLPGQTVNTLWIPVEQSMRKRSASLNSLRDEHYMTMKPSDKFVTPRPPPTIPTAESPARRVGTAPMHLQHKRSARSLSPAGWTFSPRKLFTRKGSSSSLKDRGQSPTPEDDRNPRASEGSRSRDISPESLRRFLVDDLPEEEYTVQVQTSDRPAIAIPEDIVEENEDDDNFATSAVSENLLFTGLSPPPQRSLSPSPASSSTVAPLTAVPAAPTRPPPSIPVAVSVSVPAVPQSRFSFSDSSFYFPQSPRSPGSNSLPSFYHSDDEEENDEDTPAQYEDFAPLSPLGGGGGVIESPTSSFARNLTATLSTYSLPQSSDPNNNSMQKQKQQQQAEKLSLVVPPSSFASNNNRKYSHSHTNTLGSPALVARGNGADEVPLGNNNLLLTSPIPNSGLDDLINELGWMADVIRA